MTRLQVRDLTPVIGAEIIGLERKGRLDDETCRLLRRVFDEKGILLLRDIDIDPIRRGTSDHITLRNKVQ